MPLVKIDVIRDLLSCPRCRDSLSGPTDSMACNNYACGQKYPAVGEPPIPVLIDGDTSIVDIAALLKSHAASPITRNEGSRLRTFVIGKVYPRNKTAEQYVRRLTEDLILETKGRPRILVIGGGVVGNGIEALYEDPNIDLIAFDIYASSKCQFLADGHQIPIKNGTIDGVVVQAVLEHVLNPQQVVNEIHRVLRPGGLVYADTPFMQSVHEGPYDFTRFSLSGHRYLFGNFVERNSGVVCGLGTTLLWSLWYFGRGINYRIGQITLMAFCWLPKLDRRLDQRVTVDGANATFFYGHSSPDKISPQDIVKYYSGAPPR